MFNAIFEFLFCPQHGLLGNPAIAACVAALPLVLRNMWLRLRSWSLKGKSDLTPR